MADRGERVRITGGNAKMISREIQSTPGGRYFEKYIWPYSLDEYLTAMNVPHQDRHLFETAARGRIRSGCASCLRHGGFPEPLRHPSRRDYVSGVYQRILPGDIVAGNHPRKGAARSLLVKKIAETVMRDVSCAKLYGNLKAIGIPVGKDSVIDYIGYIADACLMFKVYNCFSAFSDPKVRFFG